VYYGGALADNTADLTLTGEAAINYFGCSVSGAGDVNEDGIHDIIVGAFNYDFTVGKAYVYSFFVKRISKPGFRDRIRREEHDDRP